MVTIPLTERPSSHVEIHTVILITLHFLFKTVKKNFPVTPKSKIPTFIYNLFSTRSPKRSKISSGVISLGQRYDQIIFPDDEPCSSGIPHNNLDTKKDLNEIGKATTHFYDKFAIENTPPLYHIENI
jgi:hypothetical protein